MILIVGGRCQGKLAFAGEILGDKKNGAFGGSIADGETDSFKAAFSADIICHAELYIRRLLEEEKDPEVFISRLIDENNQAIVIADEIGSGIVPIEAFEREYRERAGRLCQKLAAKAREVYRVVCGIGIKIK